MKQIKKIAKSCENNTSSLFWTSYVICLTFIALSTIHDVMLKREWIDDRTDNLSSKRTKLTLLQDLWYNKMIKF